MFNTIDRVSFKNNKKWDDNDGFLIWGQHGLHQVKEGSISWKGYLSVWKHYLKKHCGANFNVDHVIATFLPSPPKKC